MLIELDKLVVGLYGFFFLFLSPIRVTLVKVTSHD